MPLFPRCYETRLYFNYQPTAGAPVASWSKRFTLLAQDWLAAASASSKIAYALAWVLGQNCWIEWVDTVLLSDPPVAWGDNVAPYHPAGQFGPPSSPGTTIFFRCETADGEFNNHHFWGLGDGEIVDGEWIRMPWTPPPVGVPTPPNAVLATADELWAYALATVRDTTCHRPSKGPGSGTGGVFKLTPWDSVEFRGRTYVRANSLLYRRVSWESDVYVNGPGGSPCGCVVGVLHSCYAANCNFYVGDAGRRIRYYWAVPGANTLGIPTIHWGLAKSKQNQVAFAVGESVGKPARIYSIGTAWSAAAGVAPTGSPEFFLGQQPFAPIFALPLPSPITPVCDMPEPLPIKVSNLTTGLVDDEVTEIVFEDPNIEAYEIDAGKIGVRVNLPSPPPPTPPLQTSNNSEGTLGLQDTSRLFIDDAQGLQITTPSGLDPTLRTLTIADAGSSSVGIVSLADQKLGAGTKVVDVLGIGNGIVSVLGYLDASFHDVGGFWIEQHYPFLTTPANLNVSGELVNVDMANTLGPSSGSAITGVSARGGAWDAPGARGMVWSGWTVAFNLFDQYEPLRAEIAGVVGFTDRFHVSSLVPGGDLGYFFYNAAVVDFSGAPVLFAGLASLYDVIAKGRVIGKEVHGLDFFADNVDLSGGTYTTKQGLTSGLNPGADFTKGLLTGVGTPGFSGSVTIGGTTFTYVNGFLTSVVGGPIGYSMSDTLDLTLAFDETLGSAPPPSASMSDSLDLTLAFDEALSSAPPASPGMSDSLDLTLSFTEHMADAPPGAIVYDSFTDADTTELSTHTANTGQSWANDATYPSRLSILSNSLAQRGADGEAVVSVDAGISDGVVSVDFVAASGPMQIRLVARYLTWNDCDYLMISGGFLVMALRSGGSDLASGSTAVALSAGTTYQLRMTLAGTSITAELYDGVTQIAVLLISDAVNTTRTRHGLWVNKNAGSPFALVEFDNFLVTM